MGALLLDAAQRDLFVGDGFPGRIYKLTLDGKVLGTYGSSGRLPGQFGWVHGIACPTENEVYVADENNFRVQKLMLKKGGAPTQW